MTAKKFAQKLYEAVDVLGDEQMELKMGRRIRDVFAEHFEAALAERTEECAKSARMQVGSYSTDQQIELALRIEKAIRALNSPPP